MNRFEELNRSHNRSGFDCGAAELNVFLQNLAYQNLKKGLSRTFVLVEDKIPEEILGFHTLTVFEIQAGELPTKFGKKYRGNLPAIKIARLAVAKGVQRQGICKHLMIDAIRKFINISKNVGVIGLFVDAKDEEAKNYYLQFGFLVVTDLGERQCVGWVERVSRWVSLTSQPFRAPYMFV